MTLFIIINWNGADDTIACLKSLECAKGDFRVVVTDNGSSDDSRERLGEFLATSTLKAELLPLDRNYGFAVGNNKAIAILTHICFLTTIRKWSRISCLSCRHIVRNMLIVRF